MELALMRGLDPLVPKTPSNDQVVDRSFVVRRLYKNAHSLIAAHPAASELGADELVANLAATIGFTSVDLAILRIMIWPRRYTLVCIPELIWYGRMHDLFELKRLAAEIGHACVLVPEAAIQRQPRLSVARAIEQAAGVEVTMEQRMEVLVHLIERGHSTLHDCALAMTHPSPYSAILHLVTLGVLRMRPDRPLCLETRIELADPGPQ